MAGAGVIAYGARRGDYLEPRFVRDKGAERSRIRRAMIPALGDVPRSLTAKPCSCYECRRDPSWAEYVRGLEQSEYDHLEAIA